MNYRDSLRYLDDLQKLGIKFGLDNVRIILDALDCPHENYLSIHVAGTNGKGSVCAYLAKIFSLHGIKTGLFTSPHLVKVEERIKIGEVPISPVDFAAVATKLRETIEKLILLKKLAHPPTFFEFLTCLAFLFFSQKKIDLAVLEVGMGGRFDATNVVHPVCSVITGISFEHEKFLGDTLAKIAFEKAGIIKEKVPVVSGVESGEARKTIRDMAILRDAPFIEVFNNEVKFETTGKNDFNYNFIFSYKGEKYEYSPSLRGIHQGRNAAVAIVVLKTLQETWMPFEKDLIIKAIENTRWEGRLEVLSRKPLFIVDGAHNEEGALALRDYIDQFIAGRVVLVFACMKDKKVEKLAEILFPPMEKVVLTTFPFYRAASPDELKKRLSGFSAKLMVEEDVGKAVEKAVKLAGKDGTVICAGSLYLVGEVKKKGMFLKGTPFLEDKKHFTGKR